MYRQRRPARPYDKTTMAPALWKLQFEKGTWPLTVALLYHDPGASDVGTRSAVRHPGHASKLGAT